LSVVNGAWASSNNLGNLSSLTTTAKTSAVAAINEVNDHIVNLETVEEYELEPETGYSFWITNIYKVGRICMLNISIAAHSATSGWTKVATIPNECKPYAQRLAICTNDTTFACIETRVTTGSELQVWSVPNMQPIWGHIMWIV
jgi:hypothetical protein